ncbi:YqaA family protein [Paralimibaculum aggregatum]|uniref:YqaA family protein n=1 Tax=Paralimibaculum aggregatum TaxID=3036245 RepID=UPI002555B057|nr:YqaA family protein [Limibaculum sp. NKW23]
MDWETWGALAGLFLAAFGAATLLPFQSEFVLGAMLAAETAPVGALFAAASVGNTLGSVANYWMGRFLDRFEGRRWFPAGPAQMARARDWYRRWGVWTLLLSWAPFADPLTVVAGVLRTPFWLFLALVAAAKAGRYAAVIWLCGAVSWC